MKRLSVFGCLAISVLACDVAMADGNQIINLAAVTDVMSKNAPAKMDRQQFVDFLSGSSVTVNDVMVACIKSIPSDVACDECSKFVKEIIAEHNKAVDVASSITAQPVSPKTSVNKDVVNKSSSQQKNPAQSGGSASGAKTQQNKSSVTPSGSVPPVTSELAGYQSAVDKFNSQQNPAQSGGSASGAKTQQNKSSVTPSGSVPPVTSELTGYQSAVDKFNSKQNPGQSGGSASGVKTQQNKSSVTPPSPVPSVASGLSGYQSPTDRLMGGSYKY